MVSRLVLGNGFVGRRILDELAEQPGELSVIAADEERVETLREEGIAARYGDPTDPDSITETRIDADIVLTVDDDPARNVESLQAVIVALPSATRVGYYGRGATTAQQTEIDRLTDRAINPTSPVAATVLDTVAGEEGDRTMRLRRTIESIDGPLAVVTHDNPDPDAIGSAVALSAIADHFGVEAIPCYYGEISHQENRAFVNLLDLELRNLEQGADLSEFGGVALVDHSRPGVNDQLPEDTPVDIVIDHHPPREPIAARYVDLRSDVGATSTLVTGYVRRFGVPVEGTVATALLYGIRIDTKDFSRELSQIDFEAASFLLPRADTKVLDRIEAPTMAPDTLDTIARSISNRRIDDGVLTSSVGILHNRDVLAQAADQLLAIDGVTVALVYGIMDETIYISARSRGTDIDIGETLRTAFDRIGSAGGHVDMAGAQIPIGMIGEIDVEELDTEELDAEGTDDGESVEAIVETVIPDRFLEAFQSRPPPLGGYDPFEDDAYPLVGEGEELDDRPSE